MLTVAAVAAHKSIEPERIAVRVRRRSVEDTSWQTSFVIDLDLGPGLGRRERVLLFNAARQCEVHKLLRGEMSFDYRLADEASAASG